MEAPPDAQLSLRQRKAFSVARHAAQEVMQRRFRLLKLVRDAYAKMFKHEEALGRVRDDLGTMLRLTRAWARREYRNIPWRSALYVVAALIYFVNPADLIPDVIAGLGFVDDAAVVAAVVRAIQGDLVSFRQWEDDEPPALPEGRPQRQLE